MNPTRPSDWWDDLLPSQPHLRPPGAEEMLRVVAYDIACPRRLKRTAELCLDYGVRVQKSVFEFWLDEDRFDQFWAQLQQTINKQEDLVLAYTMDAGAAQRRRAAGDQSVYTEKRSHYVL